MAWWEYTFFPYTVNAYLYHRLVPDEPKSTAQNVNGIPRTDEGAPLPMIYGRCRVNAPVLAWIGNWQTMSPSNLIGFGVDMLFAVGIPFFGGGATLQLIYAGDFQITLFARHDSNDRPGRYRFGSSNATEVYGGTDGNGGIFGEVEFFDGRPDQQLSDYINDVDADNFTDLQTRQTFAKFTSDPNITEPELIEETLMPGHRNQVMCLLFNWSIGKIPNFTAYSFDVLSLSTGTAADMGQSLGGEADPAAVIFDLLTSPWGKLGIPTSKVDLPSFVASSITLVGEGHGYSRAIEQPEDASTIINDVLRQTDGMLYEEPTTGKLVYKLVRNDYDPNTLDELNPDNVEPAGPGWFQVQGWNETFNQVRVKFTDRANNYADGLRIAQSSSNATAQTSRGLRGTELHFVGCCDGETARRIAARELAAKSRPMVKATVVGNQSLYQARPGSVYAMTWPELGVSRMVMRVTHVDLGQLHDGKITISLIRDVFDVATGAFPAP